VRGEIVVTDDPAGAAVDRLLAVVERGGHIALSGGSTPRRAYEQAAAAREDWGGATLWFGDDRCVAPEHEHSNYRMVKEALLDRLAVTPHVQRILGEDDPVRAGELYDAALRADLPGAVLDLALMGLGPDGHTASLFPGKPAVGERERLAVGVPEAGMEPYVPRVTMTLPVFNAAREVVFLVAGADKADAVVRAFGGDPDPATPASLVAPQSGSLTVLLDPPAAAKLDSGASS
jgi:6-phosphogluconolactonase